MAQRVIGPRAIGTTLLLIGIHLWILFEYIMDDNMHVYARRPDTFVFGEDFPLFWKRFERFSAAINCEKKSQFDLFTSFLDDVSFRRVESLSFTEDHKTASYVDLAKAFELIKSALSKPPEIPDRVALRYRTQSADEDIIKFGDAIRELGIKIYGAEVESNAAVIESFCVGVRDSELGSKLLQKTFTKLSEAIEYALSRGETRNIKKLLTQVKSSSNLNVSVLHSTVNNPGNDDPSAHLVSVPAERENKKNPQQFEKNNIICYRCQERGHYARDCVEPSKCAGRRQPIICYGCSLPNHIISQCRNIQQPTHNSG